MASTKLTSDQKIDRLYDMVTGLTKSQSVMQQDITAIKTNIGTVKSDVKTLKSDVSTLKTDVKTLKRSVKKIDTEVSHLIEMSTKALVFGALAKDRLEDIDSKLTKKSFTPFTSGAFVA